MNQVIRIDMRNRTVSHSYEWDEFATVERAALAVNLKMIYRISDPKRAFFAGIPYRNVGGHHDHQLHEMAGAALRETVKSLGAAEVQSHPELAADMVKRETGPNLDKLGLCVIDVGLEFGKARPPSLTPLPRHTASRSGKNFPRKIMVSKRL